mmetsp:Transcript_12120/g.19020  ORF Transcript_12120/g.19020 Transcript_12120/m.19020 type:complete len:133 (-) Transcript_12120:263-661(-)
MPHVRESRLRMHDIGVRKLASTGEVIVGLHAGGHRMVGNLALGLHTVPVDGVERLWLTAPLERVERLWLSAGVHVLPNPRLVRILVHKMMSSRAFLPDTKAVMTLMGSLDPPGPQFQHCSSCLVHRGCACAS